VKKLLVILLIGMFTINFMSLEAIGKTRSIKRSFSKPPQQSTIKYNPTPKIDQSKNVKKQPTIQEQQTTNPRSGSSLLRNIGLLAGGVMLGGMLASLFGGSEMLANIFGMLFNVIFLMLVIWIFMAVIGFLWRKIRGNNQRNNPNQWNGYRR